MNKENISKAFAVLSSYKNLAMAGVFVFFLITSLTLGTKLAHAGGPEERPLNAAIGTSNFGTIGWSYNMGTKFTPNTNGYIDKLWANAPSGTLNFHLYNADTQAQLASGTASSAGLGTWTSLSITPINVTAGTNYIVSVHNSSNQLSYYTLTVPYTNPEGHVVIQNGVYDDSSGTAFPSNNGGNTMYGLADVSYHTGSAVLYNTTSSQTGNWNLGTTWGGACASSCVEGTDYPGSSDAVTIASGHTVTVTGTQTVGGVTINSGGTLSLGSNTINIANTGTPFSVSGTFTPGTGKITYTGSTATVAATTYYDLTTGGTGTYTLASGTTTVTHTATIASGATLSQSSNTLVLSGTGTPLTVTGTFTASTGTTQYTGSTATVTATTFNNLTLGGSGTYTMPSSTTTINGNLTVTNGATVTKGSGKILFPNTAAQTITDNNSTKQDLGDVQVGDWCNISSTACNANWLNRKKITFDNTASSTNLTNFPVLVSLSSSNIDYTKTQNSGQDIRFVDADGTTALSYEIEKWDESGTSIVWVKVPQLDHTNTDYIYMYYNNVNASDNQSVVDTWSNSYNGVWHLPNGSSLSVADSLGINTSTNHSATATTGKIDGGANFSGTAQSINLGNGATAQVTTGTASVWVNTSNAGAGFRGLIVKQGNYGLFLNDNVLTVYDWNYGTAYSGPTLNDSTWHKVTFSFQSGVSNGTKVYVDGVQSGSSFTWNPNWNTTDLVLGAGSNDNSTQLLSGKLDEAKLAGVARTADWIKAEYNTESNTMNTFGSEEGAGSSWCNISSTACNSSWLSRRKITFDNTASSSDLTNFPVLISLTSSNIDYAKTQNSGQDIRFVDADNTTALSYEIEKWDEAGTSLVWVKVPQLDHTATDYIYMYYDNSGASDNQSATSVWDSNYKAVYHLPSNFGLGDSTSNGYNLTDHSAGNGSGKIGNGAVFDGATNYLSNNSISITSGSSITVSYWEYAATADLGGGSLFTIGRTDDPSRIQAHSPYSDHTLYWDYGNSAAGGRVTTDYTSRENAWTKVSLVFNSSNNLHAIYLNGVLANSLTNSNWPSSTQTGIDIGRWVAYSKVSVDEFRVSNSARTADWIKAEYNTENLAMNTFGSEESSTSNAVSLGSSVKTTSLVVNPSRAFSLNGSNTITLTGNGTAVLLATGTFATSTGTVDFSSASTSGTTVPALTYYNLTMNKGSNTFTAAGAITANNLTLSAGTFVAPSGNLTINGDFSNSGTFTHNSGTVVIAPTGGTKTTNIAGSSSTTFNALTNTTPFSTIKFQNGNTYTFAGTLTVTGNAQGPVWLRSASDGSQWTITMNGSASITYVDVKDGACNGGNTISKSLLIFNQGNNGSCWNFYVFGGGGSTGASNGGAGNNGSESSGGGTQGGGGSTGSSSSGPNSPGTLASSVWTNPTNAASSDNVYATRIATGSAGDGLLNATNFGFAIPSDAIIKGVVVEIEHRAQCADCILRDDRVLLIKNGSTSGTNKASVSDWPGSDAYGTYGSSTDLWGNTLTVNDVNASDFGAALGIYRASGTGGTANVDHIRITVYYSQSTGSNGSSNGGGTQGGGGGASP